MLGIVFLCFVIAPAIDLYLVYRIGQAWGFWPTAALVVGAAAVGLSLARAEGARILTDLRRDLAAGRRPRQTLERAALLAGALLLIAPGPLTDVLGLLLILPPWRDLVLGAVRRSFERAVQRGTVHISVLHLDPQGRPAPEHADLDPSKEIRVPPRSVGPGDDAGAA